MANVLLISACHPLSTKRLNGVIEQEKGARGTMPERISGYHEQGNLAMSEHEKICIEPPDHLCEGCGSSKPRLVFDQLSLRLLCEQCLERAQRLQAWSLLREDETA